MGSGVKRAKAIGDKADLFAGFADRGFLSGLVAFLAAAGEVPTAGAIMRASDPTHEQRIAI